MRVIKVALPIIMLITIFLGFSIPVNAVPPLPSSFYGSAKVNGVDVPAGTEITAWINGVQYGITHSFLYGSSIVYSISIPGDDPSTLDVIEGGKLGDTILFKIDHLTASQTKPWVEGTNESLDLTASGFTLAIISDHGTVEQNPDYLYYADGDQVTLTALAFPGWSFTGWSGDLTGAENPTTFTIHQNFTITANYEEAGSLLFLPLIRR